MVLKILALDPYGYFQVRPLLVTCSVMMTDSCSCVNVCVCVCVCVCVAAPLPWLQVGWNTFESILVLQSLIDLALADVQGLFRLNTIVVSVTS